MSKESRSPVCARLIRTYLPTHEYAYKLLRQGMIKDDLGPSEEELRAAGDELIVLAERIKEERYRK